MTPENPYFPPPMHNITQIWRSKSQLVMLKQAPLPNRCIKCNAPAERQLKRNLRWHHPALYLLVFGAALFYVIVAAIISKSATIHVGLCEAHAAARKRDIAIAWALVLLSAASFFLAPATEDMRFLFVGAVLLFVGLIYGIVRTRVVTPQKIDDHFVWLKGVNANYLQELPEWRGAV